MPEPGGGPGGPLAPPIFVRSVNPILTRRDRFCPPFTTGTPNSSIYQKPDFSEFTIVHSNSLDDKIEEKNLPCTINRGFVCAKHLRGMKNYSKLYLSLSSLFTISTKNTIKELLLGYYIIFLTCTFN